MSSQILRRSFSTVSRQMTAISRQSVAGKKGLLVQPVATTGRRFMGGHGPDISKLEAFLYIFVGGGAFAAFGLYQTMLMRDRIEAFETGKTLPFKSLTDDELLVFRQKFKELHSEDED